MPESTDEATEKASAETSAMPNLQWKKRRETPTNYAAKVQEGTYWCTRQRTGNYIATWMPEGTHRGKMLGSVSTLYAAMRTCWNHAYDQHNSPT